jgi:hypothetical protein
LRRRIAGHLARRGNPILFALGIVALVMFFMHFRGGGRTTAY